MNKLSIVGIGPGDYENMTVKADRILRECDTIIGYTVYVDLIRGQYPDKEYRTSPMTREVQRCRTALETACSGRRTALVSSGDSGIYGMAALVYELRGDSRDPVIEVIPGVTAACSGAALLGAPLTQDFAVISLSDRLTAWAEIEKRLEAAATTGMPIVLYNPVSRGRPDHLCRACDILLRHLPGETVCGVAQNIGRAGESMRVLPLCRLREERRADMFSTVFIGNRWTKVTAGQMITPRGYRDV